MRIAVDAMGGDHAPDRPVAGALAALGNQDRDFEIVLVGDESRLTPLLSRDFRISGFGRHVNAKGAPANDVNPPAVAAERVDR